MLHFGDSWLRGFMKRNPELQIMKQYSVESHRELWRWYAITRDIYGQLFTLWEEDRFIQKIPEPQWQDKDGN